MTERSAAVMGRWTAVGVGLLAACMLAGCDEDAGALDAGRPDAARPPDAGGADAASDAGGDDAGDAGGPTDAGQDAAPPRSCPAGTVTPDASPAFDGSDDLGKLDAAQILTPGAPLQDWSRFGMTWDSDYLYVAVVSEAFEDGFVPFHLYLEADPGGAAAGSSGKEYSSLVPELPFSATHLVAVRRTSDSGGGEGPYDGVYRADDGWVERRAALVEGADVLVADDQHTIAVRVPLGALGCPSSVRLAGHVVSGVAGAEWRELVPTSHTPWAANEGGYYEVDLKGDAAVSGWIEH